MKADMLTSLNRRYADIESNTTLTIATLLDAHLKEKIFSKSSTRRMTVEALNSKLNNVDGIMVVPPPKRGRTTEGIWNCLRI